MRAAFGVVCCDESSERVNSWRPRATAMFTGTRINGASAKTPGLYGQRRSPMHRNSGFIPRSSRAVLALCAIERISLKNVAGLRAAILP